MERLLEKAEIAQPAPPPAAPENDNWSDLAGIAIAIALLAFVIPYFWLAIRRFEKEQRS